MMKLLIFGLSLAFLISEAHMATITVKNNCQFTIWPGILTGGGAAQLPDTGFELASQGTNPIDVPAPWTGTIWGRTQCSGSAGSFSCATANCGSRQLGCDGTGPAPPVSLAEFTLAPDRGQDFFDVSLVDGFNLPVSIAPQGGSGPNCTTTSCPANVNSACPSDLAVRGSDGNIIGCNSACSAFGEPRFCCTGQFNSSDTCQPSDYSRYFKSQCPQAYSYAYDDETSIVSCTGGPNYLITFCP